MKRRKGGSVEDVDGDGRLRAALAGLGARFRPQDVERPIYGDLSAPLEGVVLEELAQLRRRVERLELLVAGRIFEALHRRFSAEDMAALCYKVGTDYEDLQGSTRAAKARELVIFCQQQGRVNELILELHQMRPGLRL